MENINVEDAVRETVKVLEDMKPCHSCVFANDTCTWCTENKINIHPRQYGCRKYMTNEDAVRKLAELEYQKYRKELAKLTLDMDVMGYAINAASIILEKIDQELERSYNAIKEKTEDSIKKHQESKRNRERLRKAYAQMRFNAQDMRNTYDRYVEYFFNHQFTDEMGKYNGVESDKTLQILALFQKLLRFLLIERLTMNRMQKK